MDDDASYLFNVAMMDARNITSVYAGTNVSFTSTDYQDCVADPNCTSQVLDDCVGKRFSTHTYTRSRCGFGLSDLQFVATPTLISARTSPLYPPVPTPRQSPSRA